MCDLVIYCIGTTFLAKVCYKGVRGTGIIEKSVRRFPVKRLSFQPIITQQPFGFSRFIKEPLSESTILDIQDAFLTNGIHTLYVENVTTGRSLVNTFLRSLDCYCATACLTCSVQPLPATVYDLFPDVDSYACSACGDLEEFFIERLYVDFLWIEYTQKLEEVWWVSDFEQKLRDLKIDQHIPIICLKYGKK